MASVYTHRNFYTDSFTHREAFKHSKLLHRKSFTHSKLSHTASVYTQNTCTQCFYTWRALTHTASFLKQISFCTQKSFYTQQAFTQRSFYTQQAFTHSKHLHTEHLHTVLLHMASVYTHRNFYTDSFTHREAFKHSKLLQTKAFTHSKLLQKKQITQRNNRNCSSKTGSRRQSEKRWFWNIFRRTFKMKITSAGRPHCENLLTNHFRSLDAATPIRFTRSSCTRQ